MSLPEFKVSVDTFETVVTLNGRFIGRAWQGSSTAWWVCRYQEDPRQFDDEVTAKQYLLGLLKMPLPDWALPGAPCCAHHGLICDVSDESDGCCPRCPTWSKP